MPARTSRASRDVNPAPATIAAPEPAQSASPVPSRFLTRKEMLDRAKLSYPKVWQLMRAGEFPRARDVAGRALWIEAEIEAWINGQPFKKLKGDDAEAA